MDVEPQHPQSPQLKDYVTIIRGRLWLVISITVLALVGAATFAFTRPTMYASIAEILVERAPESLGEVADPDMETEAAIMRSLSVSDVAAERLGLSGQDPEALLDHLTVSIPSDANILRIQFSSTDRVLAQRGTGAFAEAYLSYRERLVREKAQAQIDELQQIRAPLLDRQRDALAIQELFPVGSPEYDAAQNTLDLVVPRIEGLNEDIKSLIVTKPGNVITAATTPQQVGTGPATYLVAGGMLGLLLGMVLAFFLDGISGRVRKTEDVERDLGTRVLGTVPVIADTKDGALVTRDHPAAPAAEAFRILRSALLFRADEDTRVIMVTSGGIGDGKSTTAANLAVTLAQSDKKVILIAADLRRPSLHRFFNVATDRGLAKALTNGARPPVLPTGVENLRMIPSGPPIEASAHLFETESFPSVIQSARETADYVILDAPPLAISDPLLMAPHVDGLVLVVDAGSATKSALERTKEMLGRVGFPPIGAVLNRTSPRAGEYGQYQYKYRYQDATNKSKAKGKDREKDKEKRRAKGDGDRRGEE